MAKSPYLVNGVPHETYLQAFQTYHKGMGMASVSKGRKDLTDEFEYIYTHMFKGKSPAVKKELLDCMLEW